LEAVLLADLRKNGLEHAGSVKKGVFRIGFTSEMGSGTAEKTIGPPVDAKKVGKTHRTGGDLIGIRARIGLRLEIFVNRSPYNGRIGDGVKWDFGGVLSGRFERV
jgi:hypothetical protein